MKFKGFIYVCKDVLFLFSQRNLRAEALKMLFSAILPGLKNRFLTNGLYFWNYSDVNWSVGSFRSYDGRIKPAKNKIMVTLCNAFQPQLRRPLNNKPIVCLTRKRLCGVFVSRVHYKNFFMCFHAVFLWKETTLQAMSHWYCQALTFTANTLSKTFNMAKTGFPDCCIILMLWENEQNTPRQLSLINSILTKKYFKYDIVIFAIAVFVCQIKLFTRQIENLPLLTVSRNNLCSIYYIKFFKRVAKKS